MKRRTFLALSLLLPTIGRAASRDLSGKAFTGENPLGVSRAEFRVAQDGMDLIYQRRYAESLELFEEASIDFPDSPLGPVGRQINWQAMMYENYDFEFDRAWRSDFADANERLKRSRRIRSQAGWYQFLEAVHLGMDAMYDIRQNDYLSAFNKAWDALELIKKVQRLAPDFADVDLALGMYNYWRTAITERVDGLPSFGDHREEGLKQMRRAAKDGLLAPAPASLVLTYSYLEGKDYKNAIAEAEAVSNAYPQNILVLMTLGRIYQQAKRHGDALATFERILEVEPKNKRVWFHIGEVHYKSRKNNKGARAAYERYLRTGPLDEYRAHTYYRLGMISRRARNYDEAIAWFEKSIEVFPKFKKAKKQLDKAVADKAKKPAKTKAKPRTGGGEGGKTRVRIDSK